MREFNPGNSLLTPLDQEQVNHYEESGFLLIKKGVSSDLAHAFNEHIYHVRSQDPVPDWAYPHSGKNKADLADRFSVRMANAHLHDGFTLQMMKLPIVRGALAQLLGDEAVGVQSMYFFKEPGSHGQAAHQDFHYIDNKPNTLIAAWIALENVDEENGCLWVIPGSHKIGLLPHGKVKDLSEHEAWTRETEGADLSQLVPVPMETGDILIFHNLLIHSSNRNRSKDRWRRSFVCHYIRHDSSVEREDLRKKISLA